MKADTKQATLSQKLIEKGKVFTLSNFLSFIRLIGAFYLYYLVINHLTEAALLLTFVLIVTDFADGYFARKLNQVSELGKVLDPIADKFCVGLAIIALYQEYGLPFWITALIIGRDVAILIGSLVLVSRLPYVTPSAWPGKIAVSIISFLFLAYLVEALAAFRFPLEILAIISIIVSSLHYIYVFYKKLKETPAN